MTIKATWESRVSIGQLIRLRETHRMWTIDEAREFADGHLSGMGARWWHVQGAGWLAEELVEAGLVDAVVAAAAWLHDLGYAPTIRRTGFHPIDGAELLREVGAPNELVGLVAHHTGASYEAEERGLVAELRGPARTVSRNLDLVTFVDLSVGPDGTLMTPTERLEEISGVGTRRGTRCIGPYTVKRRPADVVCESSRAAGSS